MDAKSKYVQINTHIYNYVQCTTTTQWRNVSCCTPPPPPPPPLKKHPPVGASPPPPFFKGYAGKIRFTGVKKVCF